MKYDPVSGELCFSIALRELKRGQRFTRVAWQEAQSVSLLDGVLTMHLNDDGEFFPWFPVQADLLAEDWIQLV